MSSPLSADERETSTDATVVRKWFRADPHANMADTTRRDAEALALLERIGEILKTQQLEDIQYELARIANLLPSLRNCEYMDRIGHLSLAVSALGGEKPNIEFARTTRTEVEHLIQRTQRGMFRFVYRLAGSTPLSSILAGVICSIGSIILLVLFIAGLEGLGWRTERLPGGDLAVGMAIVAACGSYVSVLSRLGQIATTRDFDPFLIFATGFFKPWIGIAFSFFVLCIFQSGIVQFGVFETPPNPGAIGDPESGAKSSREFLFLALAFVSGFSERLVGDFISRTETQFLGPAPQPSAPTSDPKKLPGK